MTQDYDAIVIGAACLACMRSTNSASSASLHECSRPAPISAVPGTGIATRVPDSIPKAIATNTPFRRNCSTNGNGASISRASQRRYLHFVANKFDLKRDIECNARVATLIYDEADKRWEVATENGLRARARYVICATGLLSAHQFPPYPGVADFTGRSLHSARWPKEPVDFTDKRVGIIGTGPTGVQMIQSIAPEVAHLTFPAHRQLVHSAAQSPDYRGGAPRAQSESARHFRLVQTHLGGLHSRTGPACRDGGAQRGALGALSVLVRPRGVCLVARQLQ